MNVRKEEENDSLKWETLERRKLLHTPVFDVWQQRELSRTGLTGDYVAMEAPDWVVVAAVHEGNFVLVRQWRHAEERITLEFPGGVADPGEDPEVTARRELLEETGFLAGRMTFLGKVSSNPALFKNHVYIYLAEDLQQTGHQQLDADELLNYEEMPIDQVIASYGDERFTHAYMGTALAFYLRR